MAIGWMALPWNGAVSCNSVAGIPMGLESLDSAVEGEATPHETAIDRVPVWAWSVYFRILTAIL